MPNSTGSNTESNTTKTKLNEYERQELYDVTLKITNGTLLTNEEAARFCELAPIFLEQVKEAADGAACPSSS